MSLRAIARAMGLTAPALYRYYASYEDLVSALAVDLYDELVAALERARDAVPDGDVAARLLAVSRAFRAWSLNHPPEFGLLFANPITRPANANKPDDRSAAGQRFGMVFSDLVAELWRHREFPATSEVDRHPQVADQLGVHRLVLAGVLPPDAMYVFLRCWARLYGIVTMEVFGHLRWALEDTQPLFEDVLADNARALGILDHLGQKGDQESAGHLPGTG